MGIEFDEKAFRQKVEKVVQGLFERSAAATQRIFDGVFKTHAGKTAETATLALKRALAARGMRLSESQLGRAAKAIADNVHISLADAGISAEPLSRRVLVVPGRNINVTFMASGKVVEMPVHCVDSETDEIGVVPKDPATAPHMIVYRAGSSEEHQHEYDPAGLGELRVINVVCSAPE